MEAPSPTRTAINSALHRAAHLLLDADPKILVDPFAGRFAGYAGEPEIRQACAGFDPVQFPRMRTLFTTRSRFAEDELAAAIARGIKQYIILGAGLDSFAYRRPDLLSSLDVFEVDHPESQAWKRARVAELGAGSPARLHHIPIDFERKALGQALRESAVDLTRPVFFSLLGVTQYLTKDAVLALLRGLVEITASGSELAFQFVVPAATLPPDEAAIVSYWTDNGRQLGAPWLSFFEPAEMEARCLTCGFARVEHFGLADAAARYLRGRSDGLQLPAYFHMIKART